MELLQTAELLCLFVCSLFTFENLDCDTWKHQGQERKDTKNEKYEDEVIVQNPNVVISSLSCHCTLAVLWYQMIYQQMALHIRLSIVLVYSSSHCTSSQLLSQSWVICNSCCLVFSLEFCYSDLLLLIQVSCERSVVFTVAFLKQFLKTQMISNIFCILKT